MLKDALRPLIYQQLAVLDSFERAFASIPNEFRHFTWVQGIDLIRAQLYDTLQRSGVTPIEAQGKPFNPVEHEAVAYEETSSSPEDSVTAELQAGYKLHDHVLRPTLVKIARAPQPVASGVVIEASEANAATNSDNATDNTSES